MLTSILPAEIASALNNHFKINNALLFCQISTVKDNIPHVCTVRIYGIEEDEGLIFVSRTTSKKWKNILHNPQLAICILHPEYRIQLQANCIAKLITEKDISPIRQKYWPLIKSDVKKIYHDEYLPNIDYQNRIETDIPTTIPESYGIITAKPYNWEYLVVNDNYPDSLRYQFTHQAKKGWIKSQLTMS